GGRERDGFAARPVDGEDEVGHRAGGPERRQGAEVRDGALLLAEGETGFGIEEPRTDRAAADVDVAAGVGFREAAVGETEHLPVALLAGIDRPVAAEAGIRRAGAGPVGDSALSGALRGGFYRAGVESPHWRRLHAALDRGAADVRRAAA